MKIIHISSDDGRIAGWYLALSDCNYPSTWSWNDRGNGPEITEEDVFGPYESEEAAFRTNLATILSERFAGFVGTERESELDSVSRVRDYLMFDFDADLIDSATADEWDLAWETMTDGN